MGPEPARLLPLHPSLEQLKKQAKDLLDSVQRGDPSALDRFRRYFPAFVPPSSAEDTPEVESTPKPALAQAQLVIAREFGFASWAKLRAAVELAPLRALLEKAIERPIDWPSRRSAMEELGAAGPDGMRVALAALSDPNPDIRKAALGFIDHHATDACVPQLMDVAQHDPDSEVRRSALHALSCERCKPEPLESDVLPLLIKIYRRDPNRLVRKEAGGALFRRTGSSADPRVQEAYRAAVRDDPSALVRRGAVYCLRGDDALPLLAHIAERDPDTHVRVAAAERLGVEPYLQLACRVLEAALRDSPGPQVTREAHQALKRFSPEYRQRVAQRARDASLARARAQQVAAEPLSA